MPRGATLALVGGTPVVSQRLPRWPEITDADVEAVLHHLRGEEMSAYEVVDGPLFDFERELSERFEVQHALLTASGTAALQSAIFGLGLGVGDEVVVPAITFQATGTVPLHFGLAVRIADVDPESGNPGVDQLARAITSRTRAVVLAHAWGLPAELTVIRPFLERQGIALVEDAARALGSRCGGRYVGSFGVAGCLSFHELKAVPAGEGGVLLTSDRRIYERAVALGHYFRCKSPHHLSLPDLLPYRESSLGLNLKIHPLAACLARSQFSRLDARLDTVSSHRAYLTTRVADVPHVVMQQVPSWADRVSHYGLNLHWRPPHDCAVSVNTVVKALRAEGVHASTIGSPPLFRMPLFRLGGGPDLPGRVAGPVEDACFPGAMAHAGSLLRLPTLFSPSSDWIDMWVEALHKVTDNLNELQQWERSDAQVFAR